MAVQGSVNLNPLKVYIIIYTLLRGVECLWGGRWGIPPIITAWLGLRRYTHAYPIHDNVVVATTDQLQHIPTSPKSISPENNSILAVSILKLSSYRLLPASKKENDNACPYLPTLAWIIGWRLHTHLFDLGPTSITLGENAVNCIIACNFLFLNYLTPELQSDAWN